MIVVIFVATMLVYNIFSKSGGTTVTPATASPSVLGADLLKMSKELSKAVLSQELFSSPAYLYLIDFTVPLPVQPVGRRNPFDAIGRE